MKTNSQVLMKEDLIDAVLKERMVKRNTILLALQNRKRFVRNENGKYALLQKNQTQIKNDSKNANALVGDLASTTVAEDQTSDAS